MTRGRRAAYWGAVVLASITPDVRAAQTVRAPVVETPGRAAIAPQQTVDELSALLDRGELSSARTRVDAALERYPADAALHNIAGAIDAQQGAFETAEGHFRAAIARDPQLESAYLNLGRLYQEHAKEGADRLGKALEVYRELLRVHPTSTEGLFQAGYLTAAAGAWSSSRTLLERLPPQARARPQVLVLLAADLMGLGDRARAYDTAEALLKHPDLAEEDVIAAIPALDRLQDDTLAERLFEGLDLRQRASFASLRRLGLLQMQRGRFDRARALLERALASPDAPATPLLLDLARVSYKEKAFERALGYLAHARDGDPQNAEVHFFFGIVCIELNLGSEAYDSLKKAVTLAPENPYVNYALGAVAIHRHEPSEALPYFEAYVRLQPNDPRGRFALGAAKFYSNDFDGARTDLERAARTPATAAGAHYFLARIARQENDLDKARRDIALALQLDSNYPDALAELGLLQTRGGEYQAADASLTKALSIDPENYAATVNLAALYTRTRDPRRAEQAARLSALQEKRAVAAQEFLRMVQVVQ